MSDQNRADSDRIDRRQAIARMGALAMVSASGCAGPKAAGGQAPSGGADPARPNIVLLVADDLGYGDVACYGATDIRTPHIDSLAKDGLKSTQFYVSTPVCAPTRVSLMTGRYPGRTTLNINPNWQDPQSGLSPDEVTIAELLKARGYATGLVGKWHLGYSKKFWPLQQGFDEHFGFISGWADYYTHNYRKEAGNWMVRGNERKDEPGYLTELFKGEAVSFINRHAKQPFFLYVAFNAPHDPILAPEEYVARSKRGVYGAMVECLDDAVGTILAAIHKSKLADKTLVIFMSDNGAERKQGSSGPLRGIKRTVYEGGIRVPFVARWPGRIPPGSESTELAISMDLFTTFAHLGGADLPKGVLIDGKDIMSLLAGKGRSPHEVLCWSFRDHEAVRRGRWKLVCKKGEPEGLYDVPADVGEKNDLSAKHPDIVGRLLKELQDWRAQMRHPSASG